MKDKEHNALAELAKELAKDAKIIYVSGGGASLSSAISTRQRIASLIIAELARAETETDLVGLIGKCRSIAELGVK